MGVADEKPITLAEAAEIIGVSQATVRSYGKNGVNGVVLEHIPLPGKWRTSREAVLRFLRNLEVGSPEREIVPIESHEEKRARLYADVAHLRRKKPGN